MMTPLLEGELDSTTQQQVRARIAADSALAAELRRLELAVGSLHRMAPRPVPAEVREDVSLGLLIEAKPLRARYGELLDGSLRPREAAALRAEIAADAELDAEFALLDAGLQTWRAEAPLPVPAHVRARIDRAIDFEQSRHIVPIPARHPLRQRFAMAGAAAVLLFGFMVARVGERPGTSVTPSVATSQASTVAPEAPDTPLAAVVTTDQTPPVPTPAVAAPVVKTAAPVRAVAKPVRVAAAAPAPSRTEPERPRANLHRSTSGDSGKGSGQHAQNAGSNQSQQIASSTHLPTLQQVTMIGSDSGSSISGSMPNPSEINSTEPGVSPNAIDLATSTHASEPTG